MPVKGKKNEQACDPVPPGADKVGDVEDEEADEEASVTDAERGQAGGIHQQPTLSRLSPATAARRALVSLDLDFLNTECKEHLSPEAVDSLVETVLNKITDTSVNRKVFLDNGALLPSSTCDYSGAKYGPVPQQSEISQWKGNTPVPEIKIKPSRKHLSLPLCQTALADLLEEILAFHAYLKYGGGLFCTTQQRSCAKAATEFVLQKLKLGLTRDNNSRGWRFQKFLECLHFGVDHLAFGPTVLHNTDTGERGLKSWGKTPARRAQKRGDSVFKRQVANNTIEAMTLQKLSDLAMGRCASSQTTTMDVENLDSSDLPPEIGARGETVRVRVTPEGVSAVEGKKVVDKFPMVVLDWFADVFQRHFVKKWRNNSTAAEKRVLWIQLVAEVTIPDKSGGAGELVRAHSNYLKMGPWADYVSINYGPDGQYPAMCVCFFIMPPLDDSDQKKLSKFLPKFTKEADLVCLFQESNTQSAPYKKRKTLLYDFWSMQSNKNQRTGNYHAQLKCLSPSAISHRVFVVEPVPSPKYFLIKKSWQDFDIILVKDRRVDWPQSFLSIPKSQSGELEDSTVDDEN